MSSNIHQIYVANPITTNASTDLMYFGQSPYGAGNDAAMLYSNFAAQFTAKVLTTKGDLLTFSTVAARLAVGASNGQILQVNSGAATGLAWSTATYPATATGTGTILRANGTNWAASTATYPDTVTVSQILYGSSADVVGGITTANSAMLVTDSSGVPAFSGTLTNGQVVMGSTGATPTAGTITAGVGINVANGAASITISATGANIVVDQNTNSVTMAVNTVYVTNNGATLVTYTLPAAAALGDYVEIVGMSAGLFTIAQGAGQSIMINGSTTTVGAGGSLTATATSDSIKLRCVVANTTFVAVSYSTAGFTIV